jgi:hypothetical protein
MAQNTITLQQAQKWAQNWRDNPSPDVYAFLIPEIDITQVMQERQTVNVRSYLGIDEDGKYKLMIVGVDSNGNDLIDDAAGQYIYDFTTGCPKICDVNSPLFTL